MPHIAVIGGGLAGLTSAIRLAERGMAVELFEAAPQLGGRTRSFFDPAVDEWVDNGPHLLIGAYERTQALLATAGAQPLIAWQSSLLLPLWEASRGHFRLQPSPMLPLPLAMLAAVAGLPGHGPGGSLAMLRMALAAPGQPESVRQWFDRCRVPAELRRDLLEPLCLGAMNETTDDASALSFNRVLKQAFASHRQSRLGWFTAPLSQVLIAPLQACAERLGVVCHTGSRISAIAGTGQHIELSGRNGTGRFDHAVLATPTHIRNSLFAIRQPIETRAIANLHLWFDRPLSLPYPLVGMIGTTSQWLFDISQQMQRSNAPYHYCIVISDFDGDISRLSSAVIEELALMQGERLPELIHRRVVVEKRATAVVRPTAPVTLPERVIDACEQPAPGDLPATIESAVLRGEQAANLF